MAHIFLFRHGQTFYNRKKIFTGWKNSTLTLLGRKQARELGKMLNKIQFDVAYSSSLVRARDTLTIVLKKHPECKKIIIDDRIIERSYGELSGKSHQKTIEMYGLEQFEVWHRGWAARPPGGESYIDVKKRVADFISSLKKQYGGRDLNIAISAHGNSIRLFRHIMEDSGIEETCRWTIPYNKFFEYEI
jgi:2,3-bisphosphoglycerate-dependent phosphoglycerate mutase